ETLSDRIDGAEDAGIVGLEESDAREIQQTGIELVAVEDRDEASELAIESAIDHGLANFFFCATPDFDAPAGNVFVLREAFRASERRPRHHLRVHMLLARGALLPDPAVGLLPLLDDTVGKTRQQLLDVTIQIAGVRIEMLLDRAEYFAIDVELQLVMRVVARADRTRLLIALEMIEFSFRHARLAENVVQNLQ